jgi:hypothetical protein
MRIAPAVATPAALFIFSDSAAMTKDNFAFGGYLCIAGGVFIGVGAYVLGVFLGDFGMWSSMARGAFLGAGGACFLIGLIYMFDGEWPK